jgi:predicted Zn-dependent peptidase
MADVTHYYHTVFRPDLTTIVVTGKVTPERAAAGHPKVFWRLEGGRTETGHPLARRAAQRTLDHHRAGLQPRAGQCRFDRNGRVDA